MPGISSDTQNGIRQISIVLPKYCSALTLIVLTCSQCWEGVSSSVFEETSLPLNDSFQNQQGAMSERQKELWPMSSKDIVLLYFSKKQEPGNDGFGLLICLEGLVGYGGHQ